MVLVAMKAKPIFKKERPLKKPKAKEEQGLLRRSPRLKSLRENNKQKTPQRKKPFNWDNATTEEITKRLLCDYNKKHGTKLEFVGLVADNCFRSVSHSFDFYQAHGKKIHLNFVARHGDAAAADPSSDKPLVLFAELMQNITKYHLLTLSIVKPTEQSNGCDKCGNRVSHPRHPFRAGLFRDPNTTSSGPEIWSEQAAAKLSEIALQWYNKKNRTTIKFERALNCCSFVCSGLSMDFREKNTKWVHMNFEVRVGVGSQEHVVRLFGELYSGDDGEYVLATLSHAPPQDYDWILMENGEWIKEYTEKGCVFCPADILHPHAFASPAES